MVSNQENLQLPRKTRERSCNKESLASIGQITSVLKLQAETSTKSCKDRANLIFSIDQPTNHFLRRCFSFLMSLNTRNTFGCSCCPRDETCDFSYIAAQLAPKVLQSSRQILFGCSPPFSSVRLLCFTLLLRIISPSLSSSEILSAEFSYPEITTHGATLVRFSQGSCA